jgi:hypothetical protein
VLTLPAALGSRRHLLIALVPLMLGCGAETGLVLEVTGPAGTTSVAAGVTALRLLVAHPSYCDRWVLDETASSSALIDVAKRDLTKSPYQILLRPVHVTDLSQPVYVEVLALGANQQLLGRAAFGQLDWKLGEVRRYTAALNLPSLWSQPDAPKYLASDGCACLPGLRSLGTGSQTGCDLSIPTSVDRLADTAGCELPPGSTKLTVASCDGQTYPNETPGRELPCFRSLTRNGQTSCHVGHRTCQDHDGVAYTDDCQPGAADPTLPSDALCKAYLDAEQDACGDVLKRFTDGITAAGALVQKHCTVHITKPAAGAMPDICGGRTRAPLQVGSGTCVGTMLDNIDQPPFVIGFSRSLTDTAQPLVQLPCPLELQIDRLVVGAVDAVPSSMEVYVTVGDQLVLVRLDVVVGCTLLVPALVCDP